MTPPSDEGKARGGSRAECQTVRLDEETRVAMVGPVRYDPSAAEGSGDDNGQPVSSSSEGLEAVAEVSTVKQREDLSHHAVWGGS